MSQEPPVAPKRPHSSQHHGHTRVDDYAWLKDENWRDVMRDPSLLNADIKRYLDQENTYTKSLLDKVEGLQEDLFLELKGRVKEDDSSVPQADGPFEYYARYAQGGQHPVFCRRERGATSNDAETVLLDADALSRDSTYFNLAACEHSPAHDLLAYAVDRNGSEIYDIRFKRISDGYEFPDEISGAHGSIAWADDGEVLFYTVLDDNHRPAAVRRHRLGTSVDKDVTVYEEADAGFFVSLGKTSSHRYVTINAHDHTTSEVWLIDAQSPETSPSLVAARTPDIEYSVAHHDERLIILTNADDAEDFKLVSTALAQPERAHWQDIVSHRAGTLVIDYEVFKDYLVRMEREDGHPRIVITALRGGGRINGEEHEVAFDEEAYSLGLVGSYEFDTKTLRFTYSSLATPQQTFDYDMSSRERTLRKTQEVPSGHDASEYITRRLYASARDGEKVPISLIYHRDTALDGNAPLLLYGYGAYGHAIPSAFSTSRLSLVQRGFVYAIAHIRGGMERGYRWYRDGKLLKKKNTFGDFIAAAEHLIAQNVTSAGQIACHGGSAGGMLVGTVTNMRPDLFKAVVAEVPFVDVLNTMCDSALPLTPPEWPEWGNPLESEEAYNYIESYSPYDNVAAQAYPHIFASAGLTDPRVTYWEPAKWVAKLRQHKTDDHVLLLKTNMSAGHGGAAGRFERLHEVAEVYAFLLMVFDRKDTAE